MCLVKVKEEEDVVVPYRVVRNRSPSPRRRASHQRVSRTEIIRESRPQSSSYVSVPAAKPPLQIPAPQPVPVFVQPPPPPPAPPSPRRPHVVEVSPRSSVTSHSPSRHSPSRSDYVVHEREYRRERRDYSPARSSAYGDHSPRYETFRYVEPAPEERYERYARRERSRSRDSRGYGHDPRGSYRETRERVVIVDDDGRRRREYRR